MLPCELRGDTAPPLTLRAPNITWRAGIDISPLDPVDTADVDWLRALVWAGHPGRLRVLDRALQVAGTRPAVPIHAGDATELLPILVAAAPANAAACVMHTAFLAHLPPADRSRFERQVIAASASRPVWWISAEPRTDPHEPRLRLARCDNGKVTIQRALARYQPHGAWIEWIPSGTGPPGHTS